MSDSEVNAHFENSTEGAFRAPANSASKEAGESSCPVGTQVDSGAELDGNDDDDNLDQYLAEFLKTHNLAGKFSPNDREEESHQTERAGPRHESGEVGCEAKDDGGDGKSLIEKANIAMAATPPPLSKPELTRRPPANPPESHDDLNAMRQLAVSSARGAIKVHAFQKSVGILRFYFLVGVAALLTSTTLVLRTPDTGSNAYLVAVGSFAVAALSCLGFLRRSRKAGRVPFRAARRQASLD